MHFLFGDTKPLLSIYLMLFFKNSKYSLLQATVTHSVKFYFVNVRYQKSFKEP